MAANVRHDSRVHLLAPFAFCEPLFARPAWRPRMAFRCWPDYFDISGNMIDSRMPLRHSCGMRIDDAAARLEALGNPTRLRIYRALVRAGDPGMPVGKLQAKLDIAASTLSHHLKALITVDLVTQERQTTSLICRANYQVMNGLLGFLAQECCADAMCVPSQPKAKAA